MMCFVPYTFYLTEDKKSFYGAPTTSEATLRLR